MGVRAAIVDLDGTVYRGDSLVPGAAAGLEALRRRGVDVLFCSNNPTKTPAEYVERLAGMGVAAEERSVLPASTVTRTYLAETHPDAQCYLVGDPTLRAYLRDGGVTVADDPAGVDVLVASWDESFDYGTMARLLRDVPEDALFIGTDPDRTIPTDGAPLPGSGAVVGAVAATLGRDPDVMLGKPGGETVELALDRLGVPAEDCLVVGDRLDTDVAMGERAGMTTAVVLSGVTDRETLAASDVDPDHVFETLADVERVLD